MLQNLEIYIYYFFEAGFLFVALADLKLAM